MSTTSDDERTREEMETEHWRLACWVLKHHNDELRMKCSQLKRKHEEKEAIEISRKHDEPNVIVYKRKKYKELEKKRDAAEIEHLKMKCKELETISLKRETELEDYEIKCEGLSGELKRQGKELEKLRVINGGLYDEIEEHRSNCIGMEEQIKELIEDGKAMSQREKSAGERICHLGEIINKMQTDQQVKFRELEIQVSILQEENATLRALKKIARKGTAWSRR